MLSGIAAAPRVFGERRVAGPRDAREDGTHAPRAGAPRGERAKRGDGCGRVVERGAAQAIETDHHEHVRHGAPRDDTVPGMTRPIESVVVVGYGVMGEGIVRSFADAGFRVTVVSRRARSLAGVPPGVTVTAELPASPSDLVIETIVEEAGAKRAVYKQVEAVYPPETIIGTNTSGLPLETLAAGLAHPERFVGVHWFHPADVFPMVEVVAGPAAPAAILERVATALERTGKEPIILTRPVVGYVINRLQHTILHEAYHMIDAGIASAATIDKVARWLLGPRMCVTGLVEQKDIAGLTIHAFAQRSIVPTLHHTATPNAMLQSMVARGDTGLEAGRGFFDWAGLDAAAVRRDASARLRALLDTLERLRPAAAPRSRAREELP